MKKRGVFSDVPLSPLDPLRFLVSEERIARHLEKYAFDVYLRLVLLRPSGSYGLCCNQRN